ncbi:MAG TPA: type I DNA topoisomerase [Candidatus Babeliales bacterium]|nr:type I DNA topoisomerase [Candidatus Babeliales bacterium]
MKKLLIVESPAKIKTISKFLGNDFHIMSTLGHIMDLPLKKLGVTIDDKINLEYVVIENKNKTIADIVKAASTCDEIYLAPDPDREGEIIAWHISREIAKVVKDKSKIHRITFNEITESAIKEAIAHPGKIDLKKVAAQQARRILDRWVGYEVSPVLWRKIKKGLSAGRVQSVALKLICLREKAIRDFKPEEYWSIHGLFKKIKEAVKLEAQLTHINKKKAEIKNKTQNDAIVAQLKTNIYEIANIEDKKRIKNPYPPFMTSTLQQAAYNQLGFNVKRTMQIAQNLYEGVPMGGDGSPTALITYMRTDSLRISDTALTQARDYISKNFGKDYLPSKALVYGKKAKAQDAHEAIRPIKVSLTPEKVNPYLTDEQAKLYTLIWQRFVACQMTSAEYAQRIVTIEGGPFTFKVTGSTLIFDGFLKVYGSDEDEDKEKEENIALPKEIKVKDQLELNKITPKQHFTQAPARYSEATLVKELEKEGIGRPSTYATILNTIRKRDYTTLEKKRFVPTELGMAVSDILDQNLPKIMNIKFTAHLEEDLDKIAQGEVDRDTILRQFYDDFQKDLEKFAGQIKKPAQEIDITCPECKKHKLAIRFGKSGEFLGCLGYPECSFTTNFVRDESGKIKLVANQEPQLLEETCPQCKKNKLRTMMGKYGPFTACSGYPECKYIKKDIASFKCPLDGGDVSKRKWRGGSFWGCDNYPKCKFAVFADIQETPCPKCKLPFLIKKVSKDGTVSLSCSSKTCDYKA